MPNFLFAYRMPKDYRPGSADTVAAWNTWFESMGASLVDRGNGVIESSTLGHSDAGTRLGGYSLITADDFEAAVALAKGCPALKLDKGGVEIGALLELDRGTRLSADAPA